MARRKRLRLRLRDGSNRGDVDFEVVLNTRLTPGLVHDFCKLVVRGLPLDGVCDFLSINPRQFWDWTKRGKSYLDGDAEPEGDAIYGFFVQKMRQALAKYRLSRVDRLHHASNWVREMAILERRDRDSFGRNDPQGGAIEDYDSDERFL